MRLAIVLGMALIAISVPAEARRCINGKVMAPNGQCVRPEQLAAMPQPAPSTRSSYKSCPMDFAWESSAGRCVPVKRCPFDMALSGNTCKSVK